MGRWGVHSGTGKYKTVKVDRKHIHNRKVIPASEFSTTWIGTISSAAVTSGIEAYGPMYTFRHDFKQGVEFKEVVPSNIPRNVKADVVVYFTSSGANLTGGSGVAWDIDYRVFDTGIISGTDFNPVSGRQYTFSGAFSNATATGRYIYESDYGMSGTVNTVTVTIPKADVRANSIIHCILYRDISTVADNLIAHAYVPLVLIEYVDA